MAENQQQQQQQQGSLSSEPFLPPGFRFHPTDEELVSYYLTKKVLDSRFAVRAIAEVDLNKCEPWDLPEKAKMGEKEWYFFSLRDRKYPTGMRTNRATDAGYWKATGKDRDVLAQRPQTHLVGMKKTLVFYRGRAPKGEKTNWIMHEYRLEGDPGLPSRINKDEWVVCRIFQKSSGGKRSFLFTDTRLRQAIGTTYELQDAIRSLPSPNLTTVTDEGTCTDCEGGTCYNNCSVPDMTWESLLQQQQASMLAKVGYPGVLSFRPKMEPALLCEDEAQSIRSDYGELSSLFTYNNHSSSNNEDLSCSDHTTPFNFKYRHSDTVGDGHEVLWAY